MYVSMKRFGTGLSENAAKEGIYASEWIRNAIYGYLGISKAGGALDAEA